MEAERVVWGRAANCTAGCLLPCAELAISTVAYEQRLVRYSKHGQ